MNDLIQYIYIDLYLCIYRNCPLINTKLQRECPRSGSDVSIAERQMERAFGYVPTSLRAARVGRDNSEESFSATVVRARGKPLFPHETIIAKLFLFFSLKFKVPLQFLPPWKFNAISFVLFLPMIRSPRAPSAPWADSRRFLIAGSTRRRSRAPRRRKRVAAFTTLVEFIHTSNQL